MHIEKINIEYAHKSGFSSTLCDGIRHTKVLPYLSIVQAVEGSYDIRLDNGETYNTGNGGFFIAPSDVQQFIVHNMDSQSKKMVCRWIFLKIKINDIYNFDENFSFPTILQKSIKSEMNTIFDKLFCADNTFDEYICYHKIIKLLFSVSNEKVQIIPKPIERSLCYIKNNYGKKISVDDIAKEACLSSSHLFAVFKKELGVTPISYLNNYRISIAAELLQGTTKSINQISADVGINDPIYFSIIFKKHYQMSPSKFRELYNKSPSP